MSGATSENIRLLVVGGHDMVVEMISMFLSAQPGIEVNTAKSLDDALAQINDAGPYDILLLNYNMPGMNGIAGLTRGIKANRGRPVAIFAENPARRLVEDVIGAGGAGVIPKTNSVHSLTNAVRSIHAGEQYLPPDQLRAPSHAEDVGVARLSEKEILVLSHLAEGKPNKVIANELALAEATVKMHVKSICKKLGVSNRTQAALISRDLGIV